MNTNWITDNFFRQYFVLIFTDQIFSIANSVGIYRQKYFIGIYQGNPSRNRKTFIKPNRKISFKFLWMILQLELFWIQTGMSIQWHVYYTDRMDDGLTDKSFLLIPSIIVNIWSDHRPSPPLFLFLPICI